MSHLKKKKTLKLTAADVNYACLVVERKLLQLHGTLESEREALTVKHLALGINAYEPIGHGYSMRLGVLGIAEERVRRPHLVHQVVMQRDVLHMLPRRVGVHEPRVVPFLAKVAVDRVLHIHLADLTYRVYVHVDLYHHRFAFFIQTIIIEVTLKRSYRSISIIYLCCRNRKVVCVGRSCWDAAVCPETAQ